MGIDIRDRLMVGAYVNELGEFFNRLIEEGDEDYDSYEGRLEVIEVYFDYMSPYYDADIDDWFIGYRVENEQQVGASLYESIRLLSEKFKELTGVEAVLKGAAHVF